MNEFFDAARRRWDAAAESEEAWAARPSVNRALRWREIERHLSGVRTILDVGGGTGAFSIPLAARGYEVTHFDLSPAMIAVARRKSAHLPRLRFVTGNATDLSQFGDRSFDLVLNMDGAISGSGAEAERVIHESCRVAGKTLIASMAHQAYAVVRRLRGESDGGLRAFTAAEVRRLLAAEGLSVARAGGVGSLATLCGSDAVAALAADAAHLERFVDACERFDRDTLPDGPGTYDDTGLLAVARR